MCDKKFFFSRENNLLSLRSVGIVYPPHFTSAICRQICNTHMQASDNDQLIVINISIQLSGINSSD